MERLHVGDRVIYTSNEHGSSEDNPLFEEYDVSGIIKTITPTEDFPVVVVWDNGAENCYDFSDLELFEPDDVNLLNKRCLKERKK